MPTLASACCSASAVAFSFGPLGAVDRCWSRSRSAGRRPSAPPWPCRRRRSCRPARRGRTPRSPGSAAAGSSSPCRHRRTRRRRRSGRTVWSAAYMTALRHSMLSNGFTVGLIEVYQRRAIGRVVAHASLPPGRRAPGSAPPAARRCRRCRRRGHRSMSRLSMSSALTFRLTSYLVRQRLAVRVGRLVPLVVADQGEALAGLVLSNLYGPVETTASLYFAPVSLSCGTGMVCGQLAR